MMRLQQMIVGPIQLKIFYSTLLYSILMKKKKIEKPGLVLLDSDLKAQDFLLFL